VSDTKKTLFALFKSEYQTYTDNILTKRRMAHEYLNHFLVIRQPDEWVPFYGHLCEYIGILYHFEEALEKITLEAHWEEEKQQWLIEEPAATALIMLLTSELMCRDDLLSHNVSFLKH